MLALLLMSVPALGHTVHHQVRQEGGAVLVRVFFGADQPASYSEYAVFAPGEDLEFQIGRTDRRGFVSFVPDRPGSWRVEVSADSEHGFHGTQLEVQVGEGLSLDGFSQPLVATHTRLVVGVSVLFGLFGLLALFRRSTRRID